MQGSYRQRDERRLRPALACLLVSLALAGCETSPGTQTARLDVRAAIARGDIHSPKAAALAVASIDGAPDALAARLRQDMASEAATRDITITDPALARYVIRGYLDAYPTETGTSVHTVWDVFDSTRQRRQRLDDAFELPGSGSDPWAGVNDDVLANIAARTADNLAIFLGSTPEAAGGSSQTASLPTGGPTAN